MQSEYLVIRMPLKQLAFLVLCSSCFSVRARAETDDVVARVNGEAIRRSSYERYRGHLDKNLSGKLAGNKPKEQREKQERDVLKSLIDERVLRQRAAELGFSPETEVIKYLDQMRQDDGLDDFESLERSFVATGVDPGEFKHDLEQQLLKDHLLRTDAHGQLSGSAQTSAEVSTREAVNGKTFDLSQKEKPTASQNLPPDYIRRLRRASIIQVKHGFIDTGVVYSEDLKQDLLIAARVGDTPKIRTLLAQGTTSNTVDADGYSPLMHAAEMGHAETVEALLTGGAQPNAKNHSSETALLLATVKGYKDIVSLLLASGADADVHDADGITPLIYASGKCHNGIVGSLLERTINLNAEDESGRTALIAATMEGCSAVVTALLSKEADPNVTDSGGRTALMYAVESGRKDLIQALLRKDARIDTRDKEGKTALAYAVIAERTDLARQLVGESGDVNSRDNEDQTPLMYAAAGGSESMVQMLLDVGADTKAQTWSLRLIRYNPVGVPLDPTEADYQRLSSGLTALDIAERRGHTAVVELLKKADAKRE